MKSHFHIPTLRDGIDNNFCSYNDFKVLYLVQATTSSLGLYQHKP